MKTATTCPVTYAQALEDWKNHWKNLNEHGCATEVAVVDLEIDGEVRPTRSLLLNTIDYDPSVERFTFEGTYMGRRITGWVQFNGTAHHFNGGEIHFA